jgi:hypothetical protein
MGSVSPLAPMPVACKDVGQYCSEPQKIAVMIQTRMDLEFAGYTIIDGETVNAEMQKRTAPGTTWTDLPVEEQRAMLVAMGAKGILTMNITFGMPHGMAQQQMVTVSIGITRAEDNALVWSSRCSVETGDYHTTERAIQLGTQCALESSTLW